MKFKKSFLATVLAITMVASAGFSVITQSACETGENNNNLTQPEKDTYKLTLHLNGGTIAEDKNITEFEEGATVTLPIPEEREGFTFAGWFDNELLSGESYLQINSSEATSDKEFWAKWIAVDDGNQNNKQTYTIALHLNGGSFKEGYSNITSYTAGDVVELPLVEKTNYDFDGWYEDANFTLGPVTRISSTTVGNKDYYAKWTEIAEPEPDKPVKHTVTFDFNYDGSLPAEIKEVESGKMVAEPVAPSRTGYEFLGWFTERAGGVQYNFTQAVTDDIIVYAQWIAETYSVTFETNGGTIKSGYFDSYIYGNEIELPTDVEKNGYVFDGWYEDSSLSGSEVTEILKTDSGNRTFYAKWNELPVDSPYSLKLVASGGYEEGAYVEVELLENTEAKDYSVKYKASENGVADYTTIDAELVRVSGSIVRADIVGIKAGTYEIIVESGDKEVTASDIKVTSYDRSGYAHFNYNDGVGAYNDDGTLKSDATVVYVTEATKNTVQAKIGGTTYTGIVNILTKAKNLNGKPLVVRVIGTIGAATWNEIDYSDKLVKNEKGVLYLPTANVKGINGKQLPTDHKDITQEELIKGGYNTLNTSEYSELIGLNSKATYKDDEYDSAWNNCSIDYASNVTVEGIGTDARLFQWGLTWRYGNSIEVRNLTFEDYTEDACSFEGGVDSTTIDGFDSKRIWVHHNNFLEGKNYWDVCPEQDKREGDGATDFKKNSYVTISYNHYIENHKTGLVGGGDSQMTACLTFHHNWYERCSSRLPLARQANMHLYNNLYEGTTGTNMSLRANAYALIENCYFLNVSNPIETQSGAVAKVVNCRFIDCTGKNNGTNASRTDIVENSNVFGKNFDTDPTIFYYDAANIKSDVSPKHGRDDVLTQVPELSGVHKN